MNRPLTKLLVAMTLALGGLAAPAFAGQTIAISYHQVGICKGYDTAAGPVTARSDEAFAIFKIEAVDNTNRQAGEAAFVAVETTGAFHIVNHYVDWRTSWDIIVPGHFSGEAYPQEWDSEIDYPRLLADILLYERAAGVGAFYAVDRAGAIHLLNQHNNWRKSWSHIVAGFFQY